MENTKENKEKYFAQYWGQEVAVQGEGGGSGFKYQINEATITDIRNDYLQLTPLSQITDEDAIEVAKICDFHSCTIQNGRSVVGCILDKESQFISHNVYHLDFVNAIDFLRSRGYLLPFCGLSTDTLKSYGWVKENEKL